MKLKHVLNEGPTTYMSGGERYGAWEEPNDEGPEYEGEPKSGETVMPYCTADSTEIKVRVKYEARFYHDSGVGEIDSVELISVVLPSGKEVDPATATNVFGEDQFGNEGEDTLAEWLCDHLQDEEGEKYEISDAIKRRASQPEVAKKLAAPAAATKEEPTAA